MARESYIEEESCKRMRSEGATRCEKHGRDGHPDRIIFFGHGFHVWMEFKQLTGRFRAAQLIVIRDLRNEGEIVYEPRSIEEAVRNFREAKAAFRRLHPAFQPG